MPEPMYCVTFMIYFSGLLVSMVFCWKVWYLRYANHPFDTLDQRNARIHISLLTSLRNLVIGNGGCSYLFYVATLSICHYCTLYSFTSLISCLNLNIFLDCLEVWYLRYANHPFLSCVSNPHS